MLKFRTLKATFSAVFLVVSIPQIAFSRPFSEISGYPVIPNSQVHNVVCYMETQEGQILNLGRLCGEVPLVNNDSSRVVTSGLTQGSSGSNSSSVSVGSSGNCNYSWQTDSAGRNCGERAADVRSGGRSGGTSDYSSSGGSSGGTSDYSSSGGNSGSTYVRGYTRSDGTSVSGYNRKR